MIKKAQQFFQQRDFSRYVLILSSGTVLAQLVPVLVSPILTRLYSPEDFALLAFYLATANFFIVAATLRYEQAILLPKREKDAESLLALCIYIICAFSIFAYGLFYFCGREIAEFLGNKDASAWLMLIPASIVITGIYRTMLNWANRQKHYKSMATVKVAQTGSAATSNLILGGLSAPGGLVIGELTGHIIAASTLAIRTRKVIYRALQTPFTRVVANAKKYADFAKVNTPHVLMDTLQSSGLVFILASFFGDVVLGLYALMMRVLMAPVSMIGTSVAQVFYKQASEVRNHGGDVSALMQSVTTKLALFSWPIFACFMFLAPDMFQFIFGEKWREAGEFAQILTPWVAVHFVVMPIMQLPMIFNEQRRAFLFGIVGNALMLSTIFFGGYIGDVKMGFVLLSFCMVIYFGALYLWLKSVCDQQWEVT